MCSAKWNVSPLLHRRRHLLEVALVELRQDDRLDAGEARRQHLLLEAADGQHGAAKSDLAGHRQPAVDWPVRRRRDDGGGDGDPRRRAVLGDRARRHVHVQVVVGEEAAVEPLLRGVGACERQRRCADSFITSPSWPVSSSLPLPGTATTSMNSRSPPVSVQARPVATPDAVAVEQLVGAVARRARGSARRAAG
jgi:hypothetical protein